MPAHTVLSVLRCACAVAALVALALGLIGCAMVNRRYEGGVIGNRMDHQANELEQPAGVTVEWVSKGIQVTPRSLATSLGRLPWRPR